MKNWRTTLLPVLLVAVAGCGADGAGSDSGEPEIGEVPTVLDATDLRLPMRDYELGAAELDLVTDARRILMQRCMAEFGYTVEIERTTPSAYGPPTSSERRYGITDLALAREHGYGLGERDPSRQAQPERPELTADQQTVLFGRGRSEVGGKRVPDRGCAGAAGRELQRDAAGADLSLPQNTWVTTFEESRGDSRVSAAIGAWSRCMERQGHHYPDPLAAASDPVAGGEVTDAQRALAVADIGCKAEVNLVGVWSTVEAAYQRRAIDANRAAFDAVRAALDGQVRTAREVTGG
jgi:hypothetical protein